MTTTTSKEISEKAIRELLNDETPRKGMNHFKIDRNKNVTLLTDKWDTRKWIDRVQQADGPVCYNDKLQVTTVKIKGLTAYKVRPVKYQAHNNVIPGKENSLRPKFSDLKTEHLDEMISAVKQVIEENTFGSFNNKPEGLETKRITNVYAQEGELFLLSV